MKNKKTKLQNLKGFRDFLPQQMLVRNYVKGVFIKVFTDFGFEPLKTPTLEYASTLLGKYGKNTDKLVYTFKDKGDRQIALRYDLTVPVSKVLAIYKNQITLPFKRYQIQPVWRAEKPQLGRYREIEQCDIDIFGPKSPINDAEIIAIIYNILQKLNFKKFSIRINSRQVLYQLLNSIDIKNDQNPILQSLDKLQKLGKKRVTEELIKKGLNKSKIIKIFNQLLVTKPDQYLNLVFKKLNQLDIPKNAYIFDPTMVRGLDYYTGPIFETYVKKPTIGSITGGGRYDNLISQLGGPNIPAVGTTIGLDRIVDCILDQNLLPQLPTTTTKILVANFDPKLEPKTVNLANFLRKSKIPTLLYPYQDKLSKQIKYAGKKGIPYIAILGPDEIKNNTVTVKNLNTRTQQTISKEKLIKLLI
ncbi:histidine--tRNA ligase [Patescibacteria group bacterium]|nr:histidine--tRNA ligase [Patescibacteria group bacterium]MCG2701524.1 histidine--tRNA ligase [Candidatus Parcubacteria bacterium]MBU4265273.1 histidine--tRNA ligase [Patescibacteria group bacterium]MBU4389958.1 histidine--tRNA ligase [Patescibacteria group bacterium]MBU4397622.1 histidine--tRNA ligase [Patescibacteria group bacterium]